MQTLFFTLDSELTAWQNAWLKWPRSPKAPGNAASERASASSLPAAQAVGGARKEGWFGMNGGRHVGFILSGPPLLWIAFESYTEE